MYQLVELFQPLRVFENLGRQALPVNSTVLLEDFRAEFAHHIRIRLASREQDFMAEFIGLDQVTAQSRQGLSNKTFAGSQATRQTYF
jgi:hypothetical protein